MNTPTPTEGYELKEKLASLQEALLSRHPSMPKLLQEIHSTLRKQPENITLLSEEEVQSIVKGLELQTGVELAASMVKTTKSAAVTKIKSLGSDAF